MPTIVMLVLMTTNGDADATARALAAGIEQRINLCRNLRFEYTVKAESRPSPEATIKSPDGEVEGGNHVDSRDVLKIMKSNRPDVSVPWRYWERRIRGPDGEWVLDRFVGFDGAQYRGFVRNKDVNKMRRHRGSIIAFDDPSKANLNRIEDVFLADINSMPERFDPTFAVSHQLGNQLRVVGRQRVDGREVYSLEGTNDRYDLHHKLEVTGAPDYLILRHETSGAKDNKPYDLTEIRGLREFDGLAYPAAGLFRHWAMREGPDVTYEFTVTSIERLPESARENWFPDWPPGTTVADHINNKVINVPHDQRAVDAATLVDAGGLAAGSPSRRTLFFLLANICGITLLIFAILRFRKRSRAVGG